MFGDEIPHEIPLNPYQVDGENPIKSHDIQILVG